MPRMDESVGDLYVLFRGERALLEYGIFDSAEDALHFVRGALDPWSFRAVRLAHNRSGVRLERVVERVLDDRRRLGA